MIYGICQKAVILNKKEIVMARNPFGIGGKIIVKAADSKKLIYYGNFSLIKNK